MRMSDQNLNLKFVKEVEKREVLYNFNLPGYSRKDVVAKAWKEVSEAVKLPVSECREKWKNVRTVFIRKRKPSPKGAQIRRKAYYLADAMQFCLPFIKVLAPPEFRKSILDKRQSGISLKPEKTDDDECDYQEDILECEMIEEDQEQKSIQSEYFEQKGTQLDTTTSLNETQVTHSCCSSEQKDAIKMFLLSLIPEVENFSESQMKQFKRKIFNVIDDISGISYNNDPLNNSTGP